MHHSHELSGTISGRWSELENPVCEVGVKVYGAALRITEILGLDKLIPSVGIKEKTHFGGA